MDACVRISRAQTHCSQFLLVEQRYGPLPECSVVPAQQFDLGWRRARGHLHNCSDGDISQRAGTQREWGGLMRGTVFSKKTFAYFGTASVLGLLLTGCPQSNRTQSYPDPKVRFAGYSQTCDGIPGNLPDHYGYYLTPRQKQGACTWYLWAGGDPLRTDGSPENARG